MLEDLPLSLPFCLLAVDVHSTAPLCRDTDLQLLFIPGDDCGQCSHALSTLHFSVVDGAVYCYLFSWYSFNFICRAPVAVVTVVQTLSQARCTSKCIMLHSNKHMPVIAADWRRRSRHLLLQHLIDSSHGCVCVSSLLLQTGICDMQGHNNGHCCCRCSMS